MDLHLNRRHLLGAALAGGAAGLTGATLTGAGPAAAGTAPADPAAADTAPAGRPERGIHDTSPATDWTDGFLSGNGDHGVVVYGAPGAERVVLNQHRMVLPNGTLGVRPPVIADRLEQVRDLALAGDYAGAQRLFTAGWSLRWTQPFHPAYELTLGSTAGTVADYLRVTDFRTGEIATRWTADGGARGHRAFVSRAANVVVHELRAPGGTLDVTVGVRTALPGVPETVGFAVTTDAAGDTGYLSVAATYPAGQGAYGYGGATRVVATGGAVTAVGDTLVVTGATRVLLLSRLGRYRTAAQAGEASLRVPLAAVDTDYDALLAAHVAWHAPRFDASRLLLDVPPADRQLTTAQLVARQNAAPGVLDLALLERMYDAGRYHLLSSSGILPPRLTGLWAGSWNAAWADDFTTDANVNLQIAGGTVLDLTESVQTYGELILGQLADWRVNARNIYGARGLHAPTRTDGEYGYMLHFDNGFPGHLWTGGADWLLFPLVEYYQVTGDAEFLRGRLGPALLELALFYEDFLTRVDGDGAVVFVPTYSPENSPANTGVPLSINATGEVAAGRHALATAVWAAGVLGVEQGPGEGVQRWTALLGRLPAYRINAQGALAEWSWPGLADRTDHRHVQHLYPVWPLHDINPEDTPELVVAARRAVEIRGDENTSAHGSLHRALVAARCGDGELLYANLRKILGNDMVFRSLMTSHNPHRETYNADAAHTVPTVLAEALVGSRPGVLELLPAVPEQLARGVLRGIRGRNRVRVEELHWDLPAGTVTAVLRSAVEQDITLISRRGIRTVDATAPLSASPLGPHARVVALPAEQAVTVTVGLPRTSVAFYRIVNRRSGRVLDGGAPDGTVLQRAAGDAPSQQWRRVDAADGTCRFVNRADEKVLDCAGTAPGAALRTGPDADGVAWRPTGTGDGFVTLRHVRTGLSADVSGGSFDDGAPVIGWSANGAQNQQWRIRPAG